LVGIASDEWRDFVLFNFMIFCCWWNEWCSSVLNVK
jgi:hypothetical protein